MTPTEQIFSILPNDYVLICTCGVAIKYDKVVRSMVRCPECGVVHNYHNLEMVTLKDYVKKVLEKLDIE